MADGFAHGDGWFDIVWRLCEDLEPLVAETENGTGRPFEVLQVKQKFGLGSTSVIGRTPSCNGSKALNWNLFGLAKCAASRGSCGTTAFGRCAMSTPAGDPFAVYPFSINFAEAASIGCSRMKKTRRRRVVGMILALFGT